jgi:hypothetical protein
MNEKKKLKELEKGDSQSGKVGQDVEQKNWRQAGAPGSGIKVHKRKKKIRPMYAGKEQFRLKV